MRRFAANRICIVSENKILRNQVVEIDEVTHEVFRYFPLEEEIQHTEWLGGMILLVAHCPVRKEGETFTELVKRVGSFPISVPEKAYHITAFNVSSMEFTKESRIILL